jgi:hypothetical protein
MDHESTCATAPPQTPDERSDSETANKMALVVSAAINSLFFSPSQARLPGHTHGVSPRWRIASAISTTG